MGTKESNNFGTPYKFMKLQDETLHKPLQPHWTTFMQAYQNSGSTSTPFLNSHAADSYSCYYMQPNQFGQDAALAFSEMVHRTYGEQNQGSKTSCARNFQPESLITKESKENGNRSSIPKNDRDGMSWSAASGSKGSPDEGHDTNNDFPSTKKQQSNTVLGNENSTVLNQNLGTSLNSPGTKSTKLEEDEIRKKERKRQSNRESAKRSRMRKQQECEELRKNRDTLKDENSSLKQQLIRLSEDCIELGNENDSIQEELVNMYGPESIADLLPMKPA